MECLQNNNNSAVKVKMSNMLYIDKDIPVDPAYVDAIVCKHWATASHADFSDPILKVETSKRSEMLQKATSSILLI